MVERLLLAGASRRSKMIFRPRVDVAGDLEALADRVGVELGAAGRSSGRAGRRSVVPVPRAGPSFFSVPVRLAAAELHLPLGAVALDGGDELRREGVDDRGADAVQAAGGLVVAACRFELAAGVQRA